LQVGHRWELAIFAEYRGGVLAELVSADSAAHYVWGEVCDGWHLVRGEALSVIEERMPPGATEQRHFHARARQFFYVLDGALTLEVEGHSHRVGARCGVEIAPGTPHQARNESDTDVRFLVISAPPGRGDRTPA
jgi:quercetin dioxygenase-like cupin family protein